MGPMIEPCGTPRYTAAVKYIYLISVNIFCLTSESQCLILEESILVYGNHTM